MDALCLLSFYVGSVYDMIIGIAREAETGGLVGAGDKKANRCWSERVIHPRKLLGDEHVHDASCWMMNHRRERFWNAVMIRRRLIEAYLSDCKTQCCSKN